MPQFRIKYSCAKPRHKNSGQASLHRYGYLIVSLLYFLLSISVLVTVLLSNISFLSHCCVKQPQFLLIFFIIGCSCSMVIINTVNKFLFSQIRLLQPSFTTETLMISPSLSQQVSSFLPYIQGTGLHRYRLIRTVFLSNFLV